jgi:hypothetical protein
VPTKPGRRSTPEKFVSFTASRRGNLGTGPPVYHGSPYIENKRIRGRRQLFAAQDDRGRIVAQLAATCERLHLAQHRLGRCFWGVRRVAERDGEGDLVAVDFAVEIAGLVITTGYIDRAGEFGSFLLQDVGGPSGPAGPDRWGRLDQQGSFVNRRNSVHETPT